MLSSTVQAATQYADDQNVNEKWQIMGVARKIQLTIMLTTACMCVHN